MPKPGTKFVLRRRGRSEVDREHDAADSAEYERNEAEYQRWLEGQREFHFYHPTLDEGYDEPDPAYDPDDRADNEDLIVWQRGRMP